MAVIDKSKPIMVTGANGYVASWLVKQLMESGLTVHAAVRNPDDRKKLAHLDALKKTTTGKLVYFATDLLIKDSYFDAMQGCELVYHTASPFVMSVKDAQKELIEPAVNGTKNVLNSVQKTPSVKRVILTSSCAAINTDASECQKSVNGVLTEADWNTTASLDYQPYAYSKTLAEQKAWEMVALNQDSEQSSRHSNDKDSGNSNDDVNNDWDLISINMSFVMGPALNPNHTQSGSITLMKQLGDGTLKIGVPRLGFGVVDVRDVAMAHYLAGFNPHAQGRYLTSAYDTNLLAMTKELLPKYGKSYPIPTRAIPKWLLLLVGPIVDKGLTRQFIKKNTDIEWKADNSKITSELGITFRPLRVTMEDTFQSLIDAKIF